MQSIRRSIRAANPIPEDPSARLSGRAEDELTALLASPLEDATAGPGPAARRRGVRRGRLAIAVAAAVLVATASGAALIIAGSDPAPPSAIEPFFTDAQSLEDRAETIVRATLRSTRLQNVDGLTVTVATAAVAAVAKGDVAVGDEIEFAYTTPGSGPEAPIGLRVGQDYVLLLEPATEDPAFMVSSIQGYYAIQSGKAVPDRSNPVVLSVGVRKRLGLA